MRATIFALLVLMVSGAFTYLFCPQQVAEVVRDGEAFRRRIAAGAEVLERQAATVRDAALRLWEDVGPSAAPSTPGPAPAPAPAPVPEPAPAPKALKLLQWHDAEALPHRGEVDAGDYAEFASSLRRSMDEDRARLRLIAVEHLRSELEPALGILFQRMPAFIDEVFSYGTAVSLLTEAIYAIDGAVDEAARDATVEQAHAAASRFLVGRYREVVLSPEMTLAPLRTAIGAAYGALRRDLIGNCDRYDRAFRGFIRAHARSVEILDSAGGWRPAGDWASETATVRSLCHTLRLADGGRYMLDEKVLSEISEPGMTVHELLAGITRPPAIVAVNAAITTAGAMHFLEEFGLPSSWAYPPARMAGLAASNWAMAWQVLERLDEMANRPKLQNHLREALQETRAAITGKALAALVEFVSLRLDGMETVISAYGESGGTGP